MKRRVFFSVMFSVLICFFTLYGLSTAYINIQNTISKDKITSAAEAVVDKEKGVAEIYVFGEKTGEIKLKKSELPEYLWAAVPPEVRFLWIGAKRLEEEIFKGYIQSDFGLVSSSAKKEPLAKPKLKGYRSHDTLFCYKRLTPFFLHSSSISLGHTET